MSLVVNSADISGVEISVAVHAGGSCRFILVISEHYIGAGNAYLSLVAVAYDLNFQSVARYQRAYAAGYNISDTVDGNKRRAFGDALAVEDSNSHRVEEGKHILIQRRAAADHQLQLAAKRRKHG